jgi:hypothetical protein
MIILYLIGAYLLAGFLTASIMALPCITDYEMDWEEFSVFMLFWWAVLPVVVLCSACSLLETWIKFLRRF